MVSSIVIPLRRRAWFFIPWAALMLVASTHCGIRTGARDASLAAGDFPCDTGSDCPEAESPCLIGLCIDGQCALTEGPPGPAPEGLQKSGDCERLFCEETGDVLTQRNPDDIPDDDGNACTDAICGDHGPAHVPSAAQTNCGDFGNFCSGTGHCGVCLPGEGRCKNHDVMTCSQKGQWTVATVCRSTDRLCSQGRCVAMMDFELGSAHGCARFEGGTVRCWGADSHGQLGRGGVATALAETWPVPPADIAFGVRHACARHADGTVWCWGNNESGQLGRGDEKPDNTPAIVPHLKSVTAVAVGESHSCALAKGQVWCWGRNDRGQLGTGGPPQALSALRWTRRQTRGRPQPTPLVGVNKAISSALGPEHTCIARGEKLHCWGLLPFALSPAPSEAKPAAKTTVRKSPRAVSKTLAPRLIRGLSNVRQLGCGDHHCCAVRSGGDIMCWGDNGVQQLGDGTKTNRFAPVAVGGMGPVTHLAVGSRFACAQTKGGHVMCWGDNEYGQLGHGSAMTRGSAHRVRGLQEVRRLRAGSHFACASTTSGTLKCWGDNAAHQLGGLHGSPSREPMSVQW